MEQWIAQHWFNVGSTAVFLLSVLVHYVKTYAHIEVLEKHIDALEAGLVELRLEVKKVKEEGLPYMCRFHEERIAGLEKMLQSSLSVIQADIAFLKRTAEDNRLMIEREREIRRDNP